MTDMTPGGVVEAATPGSGGAGVRESGEGSKTPVPPLVASPFSSDRWLRLRRVGFSPEVAASLAVAGYDVLGYMPLTALTGVQG